MVGNRREGLRSHEGLFHLLCRIVGNTVTLRYLSPLFLLSYSTISCEQLYHKICCIWARYVYIFVLKLICFKALLFSLFLKALCKAGSFSPTGLEPCIACDKGLYQEMAGQRQCLKCSVNKTTPAEGSNNSTQCGGIKYVTLKIDKDTS